MSLGHVSRTVNQIAPALLVTTALAGTSVDYSKYGRTSWVPSMQQIGQVFLRSNATVAMTDSLPNPHDREGDLPPLPNGWFMIIRNTDASAAITLTPVGCLINGASSLSIAAAAVARIVTDGTNYFTI